MPYSQRGLCFGSPDQIPMHQCWDRTPVELTYLSSYGAKGLRPRSVTAKQLANLRHNKTAAASLAQPPVGALPVTATVIAGQSFTATDLAELSLRGGAQATFLGELALLNAKLGRTCVLGSATPGAKLAACAAGGAPDSSTDPLAGAVPVAPSTPVRRRRTRHHRHAQGKACLQLALRGPERHTNASSAAEHAAARSQATAPSAAATDPEAATHTKSATHLAAAAHTEIAVHPEAAAQAAGATRADVVPSARDSSGVVNSDLEEIVAAVMAARDAQVQQLAAREAQRSASLDQDMAAAQETGASSLELSSIGDGAKEAQSSRAVTYAPHDAALLDHFTLQQTSAVSAGAAGSALCSELQALMLKLQSHEGNACELLAQIATRSAELVAQLHQATAVAQTLSLRSTQLLTELKASAAKAH